ncbi:MAG: hypothetical protein JNM19_03255 [Chitinophagaceae bacterium]|nr:hypothetical protein [Chitinophagaceae bacterium]
MKWATLLFFLCFSFTASGQSLTFNLYTPADGLTDARVQKIYQDKRGVLYFLTRDGFSSFDGQRFQNYSHFKDQPLSVINDITEDKNGRLLISALSGIYYLQGNKLEKDTLLLRSLQEPGTILSTNNGGKIILANSGLVMYSGKEVTPLFSLKENNQRSPLQFDKAVCSGTWIVGSSFSPVNGQYKLSLYNWKLQEAGTEMVADKPIDLLQFYNTVYVFINNTWMQLNEQALQKGALITEPLSFATLIPAGSTFSQFFIDNQKQVWLLSTNKQICMLQPTAKKTTCYSTADGLPESAGSLFQDAENNYWFILNGKGVSKLVQSKVTPLVLPGEGLIRRAESVNISPEGIISLKNGNTIHLIKENIHSQEKIEQKTGALQTFSWNNDIWTLYNNGLLESKTGKTISFASFTQGTKQISPRISFDKQGRLLITGNYMAVINTDHSFISIELPYFTDNIVTDTENNYWCFARNGDILKYSLVNRELKRQSAYSDKSYSPRYALHWNKDTFCIGTRNKGIVYVTVNNSQYKFLGITGIEKGLSNNFISCLIRLGNTKLLATTVAGLDIVHFSTPDTSVEQLFSRIGLFTGVTSAVQKDDSSIIAFTDNGIPYSVSLKTKTNSSLSPSLFFNSIAINGEETRPGNYNSFAYNKNNFRFSVSAPSFIDEKNIRFIFRLNGPSTDVAQNSRSADFEYSNLLPGHYTLTATAIFPGDTPVSKTLTYSFTIKKPFWKTTVFLAAAALLLALLSYMIFRTLLKRKLLRQRIELEKQQAVALERTRIATDMHDDLGAGISTIKYLSQSAPYIPLEQQKQNNLKIAAQADELVDKMNDIIWAMNEKNDTLDNLIFYTKAWVANFTQQHQFQSHFTLPPAIPPTIIRGEKRQHIFLCVKESIHNIIKHSGAGNVWMTIEITDNKLSITIRDDGKGFDKHKMVSGNGLSNMQKRMKAVKGEMQTLTGEGITQSFTIPL